MAVEVKYRGSKIASVEANSIFLNNVSERVARFTELNPSVTDATVKVLIQRNTNLRPLVGAPAKGVQLMSTQEYNALEKACKEAACDVFDLTEIAYAKNEEKGITLINCIGLTNIRKAKKNEFAQAMLQYTTNIATYSAELIKNNVVKIKLDALTKVATSFSTAYSTQNKNVSRRVNLTAEQRQEFNDVYIDVQILVRLARVVFRKEPDTLELFNYSKILKSVSTRTVKKDNETPTTDIKPVE